MAAAVMLSASAPPAPTNDSDFSEKAKMTGQDTSPSKMDDLPLPLSSVDGLVKKPFERPLDSALPVPRPALTSDQQRKYEDLLKTVASWTEIPEAAANGASKSTITDRERMFLTRECLLRYLRATKWVVLEAEKRLLGTLVWRREYGVEKLTADYISNENETGKQVITGYDVNARPCHYLVPSKQNTQRSEKQIQHLVFMLERVIDLMVPGQETLALLINFAETKSGQGASVGQGRQTLYILQNHYPERLGRALVTNGKLCPSFTIGMQVLNFFSTFHDMGIFQAHYPVHRSFDSREAEIQRRHGTTCSSLSASQTKRWRG
jgi:CRAL/TRIO domain/CRAL/TRIO, N-terminal domain